MNRTATIIFVFVFVGVIAFLMFQQKTPVTLPEETIPEDGTYRGIFGDGPDIQVNVQLNIENGIVQETSFRHLKRDENYHLDTEEEPYKSVVNQYKEALVYLEGKEISTLKNLYEPENVVTTEVDGYTSATIRSSKIISAVRDALNRGVYRY